MAALLLGYDAEYFIVTSSYDDFPHIFLTAC